MTSIQVGDPDDHNWSYPGSSSDVARIRVFRPTWEEFKDFNKYLEKIEALGAHKGGLAKIIPPKEWVPRKCGYNLKKDKELLNTKIPNPICQVVNGNRGIFQSINVQKKAMTVKDYAQHCKNDGYEPPKYESYEELERKYWKNITFIAPLYGADVCGSITDPACKSWNINNLGSILDYVNRDYGIEINGVNTAYLYFGSWKTTFAWHTEDMDLHSINYLHFGESKFWYCIPPRFMRRFERLADGLFPQLKKECSAFLRHKMCLISPTLLRQHSIPYNKVVQHKGEIIITFPCGYHSGFNTGFNCAESTNFATPRWVEYGKRASRCHCKSDMVNISMDCFVKRFQPERYENWLTGKDLGYHPEDDPKTSTMSIAPPPSAEEFLINKTNDEVPDCILNPKVGNKKLKRHPIHRSMAGINPAAGGGARSMAGAVQTIKPEQGKPKQDEDSDSDTGIEQAIYDYDYEALEDIWLKAGEMEPDDATYTPDEGYHSSKKRRHDSSPEESSGKKSRCGLCKNCVQENCGKCPNCLDMPRFGGTNRLRQACALRKCLKMATKPKVKVKERWNTDSAMSKDTDSDSDDGTVAVTKKAVIKRGTDVGSSAAAPRKTITVSRPTEAKTIDDFKPLPVPAAYPLINNIKPQPQSLTRSPKTFESAFLSFCHGNSPDKVLGPMGLATGTKPRGRPSNPLFSGPSLPLQAPSLPQQSSTAVPPQAPSLPLIASVKPTPSAVVGSDAPTIPTMVRMDYAKQDIKPGTTQPSDTRSSLHTTIQRLKGKLQGDPAVPVSLASSNIKKDPGLGARVPGEAEEVLHQLLNSGFNLQQPIAILDRWSGGRKSEVESADESEQFVELLLKQISQFNQLTSQLSTEHKQVLQHTPVHKQSVPSEQLNRLLEHLQQLNKQQLLRLSAQLNINSSNGSHNSSSSGNNNTSSKGLNQKSPKQTDVAEWRGKISSNLGQFILEVQPPPRRGLCWQTFDLSRPQVAQLRLGVTNQSLATTRSEVVGEVAGEGSVKLFFGEEFVTIPTYVFKPDLVDID